MQRLRGWLRSDMRVLRWVFLALYVALIATLVSIPALQTDGDDPAPLLIAAGIMFAGQAILIFGSGTINLCRPIRKRRLVLPVLIALGLWGVLIFGMCIAMAELFYIDDAIADEAVQVAIVCLIGACWLWWGFVMLTRLQHLPRFTVLRKLNTWLFAGSLAELLATVPSHVIVSRRPGCLVGIGTAIGISAGCAVMLFSFGPAIVILFLRPRWRAEMADGVPYCPACGYDLRASPVRCPECGLPVGREGLRTQD